MWWSIELLALAEPGGGDEFRPALIWRVEEGGPVLDVVVPPEVSSEEVLVDFLLAHGAERLRWSVVAPTPKSGSTTVPFSLPKGAWEEQTASPYVTDLLATIDVDGRRTVDGAFVAWPDGPSGSPVVWASADELARSAPQGVLDPKLRLPDLAPEARRYPPVASEAGQRREDLPSPEVEP